MVHTPATAVLSLRNDDEIVGLSPELEELLGWTADDLIGSSVGRILASGEPASGLLPPDGSPGRSLRCIRRDGVTLDLQAECQRWRAGGDSFATLFLRPVPVHAVRDPDSGASRRAQDLEERFAALLNATPDAIIVIDARGLVTAVNASAEKMFSSPEEEIRGKALSSLLSMTDDDHPGNFLRQLGTMPAAEPGLVSEMTGTKPDGSRFPVEVSIGQASGADGLSYIAVVRDISRRQQAAADLAHSESNLRMAQALAHLGSFEFVYPGDGIMFWSDEVFRILGLDAAVGVPDIRVLRDEILHPEDKDRVVAALKAAARHGGILKLDYRVRRPDGAVRHIQSAARLVVTDPSGSWRISGTILDVSERRRIEQALRTERDRAELYLDLVGVIVVAVDASGNITMINRQGLDILAIEEEDALGRNFFQMFIPEEFRKAVLDQFNGLIRSDDAVGVRVDEGWVETLRGNRRFIRWRNKKMRDSQGRTIGVLAAGEDITEQRHVEDQLRQAEEELRLTFQHAPIGMATLDLEGHVLNVNQSLCNMLGYSDSQLLGLAMKDIIHPDDRDAAVALLRQLLGGEIEYVRHEKRYFRSDSSIMHGIVRYSLIRDSRKRPLMFVAQIVDRTEQIKAELEIRQHRERLAQVSRLGTMGEMAAGIAHELNQPLTAISNYVQACQRLIGNEAIERDEIQEILGKVGDQARRAGRVIQGLRRFVKSRAVTRQAVDIKRVLRDVIMLAELDCREHGIPIDTETTDALPQVQGDPIQLQQVLLNLIRNAVDSMAEGDRKEQGIRMTALVEGQDEVVISVIDHGTGISPEDAARLYDPFFTTKKEGMGMGLALSRSIVEAHGGHLVFTANPQGGTIFSMVLPTLPEE